MVIDCTAETFTLLTVAKAAVGPFIGAGLAFGSTLYVQHRTRRRDNLTAGNLALLTISAQYNDFLIYRRGLRRELHRRVTGIPTAPHWMLAPAIGAVFTARTVDFGALSFLFNRREGIAVHEHLGQAELHFETLRTFNEKLAKNVEDIQECLAALQVRVPNPSNAEIDASVGLDKKTRTSDLLKGLIAEINSEDVYLNAFKELRTLLASIYSDKAVPQSIGAKEGHGVDDLDPLPPSLAVAA
jgi:hypothetical protein